MIPTLRKVSPNLFIRNADSPDFIAASLVNQNEIQKIRSHPDELSTDEHYEVVVPSNKNNHEPGKHGEDRKTRLVRVVRHVAKSVDMNERRHSKHRD